MAVPLFGGRFAVPDEIVENIAYALLSLAPLDSLSAIIPLLQTSKAFLEALSPTSGTALYSRLCRLKYDVDVVERRTSFLNNKDLTHHLLHVEASLRCIRRGDVFDEAAKDSLLNALIMMLHNNGKNRAQLENVGIVPFLDRFIRLRLHEDKESNDMWPIENTQNSAALWLSWMLTTKEQLENETEEQRNDFTDLILPFLLCPYRYASAYAPSNHFLLPLQLEPPTFHTAHGPFPVYHTKRPIADVHFFQSRTSVLIPPISGAAKLLFWCRRETRPFFNTAVQIPRNREGLGGNAGLTLEDLIEFNSYKVAKLRPIVRWDWDEGYPLEFSDDGAQQHHLNDSSKQWDIDWWRIRMCQNILQKQPRWRLGNVYQRGLLTGLWQGVYFLSNTESLTEVSQTARCPDVITGLFELLPRPTVMRLQEHNFVRTPSVSSPTALHHIPQLLETQPIPAAREVLMPGSPSEDGLDEILLPVDVSISNAWIPGPIGSLKWEEGDGINPSVKQDLYTSAYQCDIGRKAMRSTTFKISPGLPSIVRGDRVLRLFGPSENSPSSPSSSSADLDRRFLYETYEPGRESIHERMRRAKDDSLLCACDESFSSIQIRPHMHPGCLKCADREEFLETRKEHGNQARRWMSKGMLTDDEVEHIFTSVGMGKRGITATCNEEEDEDDEEAVFDLDLDLNLGESHSLPEGHNFKRSNDISEWSDSNGGSSSGETPFPQSKPPHDRYRVESCDDGTEDTIITGEPDERHRLAWGPNIYYGRVRPWDGMIAILKQHPSNSNSWNYGNFLFYGYVYGGDTFVGNWRFASTDPITPGFEYPFIMSKRGEDGHPGAP